MQSGKAFRNRAATLPIAGRFACVRAVRTGDPGISWKSPNIPSCPDARDGLCAAAVARFAPKV